ncbi:MAG: acyl-CoA dehydrogenase family protein [Rhodopseudomonas palustris]|nr:acyl-CoA dehydrogenase family protein [Rhodopseudomonas palustris]
MKHHAEQDEFQDIREAVGKLCAQFPGEYWRQLDREMAYPKAFVDALTEAGYLSVLIPEEYGGAGLKLLGRCGDPGRDPARRLQWRRLPRPDVHHGHAAAPRHRRAEGASTCRKIATGELRLQAMGVTEPTTGTDTTQLKTTRGEARATATSSTARRCGSRASQHSDLMILLRAHHAAGPR